VLTDPRLKARIAGVFYLLTFLTGTYALVFVSGRLVAILLASGCYIGVTLLFYDMFKPVSRSLSLLAALVSLVGCGHRGFPPSHQPLGILRLLLPLDRLPHLEVDLPASNSRGADGVWRFGLADPSVTVARTLSVSLQSGPRPFRGGIADPMAPRHRRERTALEGAGCAEADWITGKTRLGSARGGMAEKPMRKERGTTAGGFGPVCVPQAKAPQRQAAPTPIHGPEELTVHTPFGSSCGASSRIAGGTAPLESCRGSK
jgi:hypothetical protein